jgi:formylglycine-generating enzyme required for sulfatase activity
MDYRRYGTATFLFACVWGCSSSNASNDSTDAGQTPEAAVTNTTDADNTGREDASPAPDAGDGGTPASVPAGMVAVPAGPFTMGCSLTDADACYAMSRDTHTVTLAAFAIDTFEVTRADYKACATAGACTAAQAMDYGIKQPMTGVSWDQAQAFCAWKTKRLPTEAEWEKAARGADGRPYPWGDAPADCAHATMRDDSGACGGEVTEVGTHPSGASPYGAQDMAGNAEEWVADFYDAAYYASSPATDPKGPAQGTSHVIRGGSAVTAASYFRIWARAAGQTTQISGFRCAVSL